MGIFLLQVAWLFLPAGCATMGAGFTRRWKFLNYPIDFGKSIGGKRIFGGHKTWRGYLFGTLASVGMVFVQKSFYPWTEHISLINYAEVNVWVLGIIFGLSAMLGDSFRSFFKRRVNIAPGEPWFPFDQVDWVVGVGVAMYFVMDMPWAHVGTAILLALILHPAVNYLSYRGGLQKNKL